MKTALITGGSGGLGAAMVRLFSQAGWRVAFGWHRNAEGALALARQTDALSLQGDLAQKEGTQRLFKEALSALGHLDALVVNAGVTWQGLITDMDTAAWDRLMAVNLRSAFLLSRLALPAMRPRGRGSLLFVSSFQGMQGASCEAAYAASKAGLVGLARSLAAEWGPCGIRVNCLAPGVIDTGMMADYSHQEKEALQQAIPLGRLGTAEETAQAALFLCSEEAAYITGQTLGVDGGLG